MKDLLPIPYKNPWSSLRKNIFAVLADLRLRVLEVWRLNWQGDLPAPSFVPVSLLRFYWPIIFLSFLALLLYLGNIIPSFSSLEDLDDASNIVVEEKPFSDPAALLLQEPPNNSDSLTSTDDDLINQLISDEQYAKNDKYMKVLSVDKDPIGILKTVEMMSRRNGLVLVVSSLWSGLTPEGKVQLANRFQFDVESLGFEEAELHDEVGHLLARTSRVGVGMIIFNLGGE
ncbi:hypothetical protein [Prochlorococcus sp. MIT 1300]|uniref:hypothetical protein n=1 Tax=Prochlorococcus sp. MIT 1300 TaxID=3096218 RepID=UPI002A75CC2A|nr:hypothetical protein [Prochlorococcus sp. MIT 1300]